MNMHSNGNGKNEGGSMLENFFIDQLKDIYYAEQQLLKALQKMERESTTEELEEALIIMQGKLKSMLKGWKGFLRSSAKNRGKKMRGDGWTDKRS
jgi:hypothetical protein